MEENIWLIGWKFRAADKCCWPEKKTAIAFCISPREKFRYCCTRGLLVFLKTISILPREQPKSSAGLLEIFSEFHFHVVCCAGPDNRREIDSSHTHTGHIMQVQGMVSKFPVKMCYNFYNRKNGKKEKHTERNMQIFYLPSYMLCWRVRMSRNLHFCRRKNKKTAATFARSSSIIFSFLTVNPSHSDATMEHREFRSNEKTTTENLS